MNSLNSEENEILSALGLLAVLVFSIAGGIPAWGLCYEVTWNWFAPVISSDLPIMTFKAGMAASLLVALFKVRASVSDKMAADKIKQNGDTEAAKRMIKLLINHNVVTPFTLIGVHWLIHLVVHA